MKVKIIDFVENVYNYKLGEIDICVIYTEEKKEIFRGITYFKKDGKKWCNFPNVKRGEKWQPYYERMPALSKEILEQTASLVDGYLVERELSS